MANLGAFLPLLIGAAPATRELPTHSCYVFSKFAPSDGTTFTNELDGNGNTKLLCFTDRKLEVSASVIPKAGCRCMCMGDIITISDDKVGTLTYVVTAASEPDDSGACGVKQDVTLCAWSCLDTGSVQNGNPG